MGKQQAEAMPAGEEKTKLKEKVAKEEADVKEKEKDLEANKLVKKAKDTEKEGAAATAKSDGNVDEIETKKDVVATEKKKLQAMPEGKEKAALQDKVNKMEEEVTKEKKAQPPMTSAVAAKVRKAHELRKKARQALRKEGKPIPADMEKGKLKGVLAKAGITGAKSEGPSPGAAPTPEAVKEKEQEVKAEKDEVKAEKEEVNAMPAGPKKEAKKQEIK